MKKLSAPLCSILVLLLINYGCEKEEIETYVEVNPNVKVASSEVDSKIQTFNELKDTILFNGELTDYQVNDIFVSTVGEGILRKISSIEEVNGNTMLITSEVSIAEVFPNSDFELDFELDQLGVSEIDYALNGISLKNTSNAEGLSFKLEDVVLYDWDGNPLTHEDQILADGELYLQINPKLKVETKNGELTKLIFGVNPVGSIEIKVNCPIANLDFLDKSLKVFTIHTTPKVFFLAGVPIVITNEIPIYLGIKGSAKASIGMELKNTTSVTAEVVYQDSQFSFNKDFNNNFEFVPPSFIAEANLRMYLEPKLEMKLYGVAGPTMNLQVFGEGKAELILGIEQTLNAEIYGGIELGLGLILKVMDFRLTSWEKPALISYKYKIKEWQIDLSNTNLAFADFIANQTDIVEGESVQLTDQSTGNPTSWNWDFGDGATSNQQNPSHVYTTAGNYTVSLTVTNNSGSDTEIKNDYITVNPGVEIPTSGLIAYFPFNNNANDESGNDNDGTLIGPSPTEDRSGNANSAYEFDGTNDKIVIPDLDLVQPATFSCWFKTDLTQTGFIYTSDYYESYWADYYGLALYISTDGKVNARFGDGSYPNRRATTLEPVIIQNQWHNIVTVWHSSGAMSIYVDGNLQSVEEGGNTSLTLAGNRGDDDTIGADDYVNPSPHYLKGTLDDIRIYNRELTNGEISALFNEGAN